jgi:hypothetical protein
MRTCVDVVYDDRPMSAGCMPIGDWRTLMIRGQVMLDGKVSLMRRKVAVRQVTPKQRYGIGDLAKS